MGKGNPRGNPNRPPLPNGPGHGRPKGAKNKITKADWDREVRFLAFSDVAQLFDRVHKGARTFTLRQIHEMPKAIRACISSVKVKTENLTAGDGEQDTTVEIKLWSKTEALQLGARANGWLKDKVEISAPEEMLSMLDRAKARAKKAE
jgi:hypothetical protein